MRDSNINLQEIWPAENPTGVVSHLQQALARKEWLHMVRRGDLDATGVDLCKFMDQEFGLVPGSLGGASDLARLAEARTTSKIIIERALSLSKVAREYELSSYRKDPASDATPPPELPKASPGHNISVKISPAPHEIGALGVR